jgi:hypothetical protein
MAEVAGDRMEEDTVVAEEPVSRKAVASRDFVRWVLLGIGVEGAEALRAATLAAAPGVWPG